MNESPTTNGSDGALTAFDKKLGRAAFWKLGQAARVLGLSPRMLAEDISAGRVPITVRHFGSRELAYVASADVLKFIESKGATA